MTNDDSRTAADIAAVDDEPGIEPHAGTDEVVAGDDAGELETDELVGPGRYPLRIQPAAALAPGTTDVKRLLVVWYVRKSFYWMLFVGFIVAAIGQYVRQPDDSIELVLPSPAEEPSVLATWALVFLAFGVKFVNGWIALALAVPMALAHEPSLEPRTNFGSSIGVFFDRKNLATAFRALRWTHHVRQVALRRLGPTGEKVGKLDPILDIVNIATGVLMFIVVIVLGAITAA